MDCKNLVSQMTLEEKARFCSGENFWHTQSIPRLGIPSVMLTDGPCGLRKQAGTGDHLGLNASITAVSFPTGSCLAGSFDRALLREAGEILGEECVAEDVAVVLGPAVNMKRSPLCGRNFEYFSEDPYLAGELAVPYIQGVQSKGVGTSLKHFAANSQEHRRMTSDSVVDERTLRELYLPAFEKAVKEAQPWTVMCSYNKLNGTYASENHRLLTEILREEWGFTGMVVSDWGASNDRVQGIAAGMDLEMPGGANYNEKKILAAVEKGHLPLAALDQACLRILELVYRYKEGKKDGLSFQHQRDHDKARQMAVESMVLLKNEEILPLCPQEKVAFIGKFAEKPRFQGGGSSHVSCYKITGALEAMGDKEVLYAPGYEIDNLLPLDDLLAQAVETAKAADKVVLFLGIPDEMESEGFDRKDLKLPPCQQKLVEAVCQVQKNVVAVVHCGGPIEMPWISQVKGVLYAYLGGEAVGEAVVDLLYGKENPSGKLAETFPLRLEDNPSALYYLGEGDTVEYREGIFIGYRYYDKKKLEVLFPFGHGLSYTQFAYDNLTLDKSSMKDTETLTVTLRVKNVGERAGKEIVQLYVQDQESSAIRPVMELKGFEKVSLAPGESKTVSFSLSKSAFAWYHPGIKDWYVESGTFSVLVGSSSRDIRLSQQVEVLSTTQMNKVFSINSTFGDVMADPKGAAILGKMMEAAMPKDLMESDALGSKEMMAAVLRDLPLRGALMLGGDLVTPQQLEDLVSALNAE